MQRVVPPKGFSCSSLLFCLQFLLCVHSVDCCWVANVDFAGKKLYYNCYLNKVVRSMACGNTYLQCTCILCWMLVCNMCGVVCSLGLRKQFSFWIWCSISSSCSSPLLFILREEKNCNRKKMQDKNQCFVKIRWSSLGSTMRSRCAYKESIKDKKKKVRKR